VHDALAMRLGEPLGDLARKADDLGETEPAVPTPDGVPEKENRRAVISFE